MKYIFELSSKADMLNTVEQKHKKVVDGLLSIEKPWGINDGDYTVPSFGKEIVATFRLNKFLGSGIKGDVMYRFRNNLKKKDDDRIYLLFNPKKIDYRHFVSKIIKQYIDFFEPYNAFISDEDTRLYDFDNFRNPNVPKSLFRFYPIFYWSSEHCFELLGISALELGNLLINYVESTELFKDGIFVIVNSNFLNIEQVNELDLKLKELVSSAFPRSSK